MDQSREKILKKLRVSSGVMSQGRGELPNSGKNIKNMLDEMTPRGRAGLITQFKKELEEINGEYFHINNPDEGAAVVNKIIKEKGYDRITVTGETICQDIADRIVVKNNSVKKVQALDIPWPDRKLKLADIPIALVNASFGVADIGALVFPYDDGGTSLPHFLSDCVVAVFSSRDLFANQFELFENIDPDKARNMVMVAGASRTADIEKILILGAHGPGRLIVLMMDES